jgi:flagellar biosynthesis protein FliQ
MGDLSYPLVISTLETRMHIAIFQALLSLDALHA